MDNTSQVRFEIEQTDIKSTCIVASMIALLALSLSQCSVLTPNVNNEKAYAIALTIFTNTLEVYNDTFDKMPMEVQNRWRELIDPKIKRARRALIIWKLALESNDGIEAQKNYHRIWLELQAELINAKILEGA